MTWRFPRISGVRALAVVAAGAAAGACGYDWTVRDSAGRDAAPADDGATDLDAAGDAPADHVVPADGGSDAPHDGAVSCSQLASTMLEAGKRAQSCALSSSTDCKTGRILDECGCARFPAVAGSNDAIAWQNAIAAYKDAGCLVMSCAGPCSAATSGVCVIPGGVATCSP